MSKAIPKPWRGRLICLLLCFSSGSQAESLYPSQWYGGLGYSYRMLSRSDGVSTQGNALSLDFAGSSYLVQPWLSTFDLGLALSLDNSEEKNVDRSAELVTGQMRLNIFPKSSFPLELLYQRSDSRVESDVMDASTGLLYSRGDNYRLDRFYVRQYMMTDFGLRLAGSYDNTFATSALSGDYDQENVNLNMSLRRGYHNFNANMAQLNSNRSANEDTEDSRVFTFDHQYYPARFFTVTSLVSDVEIDRRFEASAAQLEHNINRQRQVFSNFYWRPETQPFIANGIVRLAILGDMNGNRPSEKSDLTMCGNGTYQRSVRLAFNAGLCFSGDRTDYGRDPRTRTSVGSDQRLGTIFRSYTYGIGAFIYNYYTEASLTNSLTTNRDTDQKNNNQSANFSLGHTLQRRYIFQEGSFLNINFNQRGSERISRTKTEIPDINLANTTAVPDPFAATNIQSIEGLSNSASLSWNFNNTGASSSIRLTGAYTQDFEEKSTTSELVNLQFTRIQTLSRRSTFNTNLTFQSSRQVLAGDSPGTFNTLTGAFSYQHNYFFSIPQLQFISRVNLVQGDDRDVGFHGVGDFFKTGWKHNPWEALGDITLSGLDMYWDNRLDYQVGKLRGSLVFRRTGQNSDYFNSVFFRLTRQF